MRIAGFFLGFLFLSAAVSGYRVDAQVTAQASSSAASATDSATDQTQANVQEASGSKHENYSGSGEHKLRLRLGTIAIGAGYFSGPGFYPYDPYPFFPFAWEYSALWYPYWGPYSYFAPGYFGYGSAKGEVKLAAEPKTAQVYLDRAYAGTANHLKNIWLEPGAYDLSLAATGRVDFHQRIYVLSGKSLKITAKLVAPEPTPADARGQIKDKP